MNRFASIFLVLPLIASGSEDMLFFESKIRPALIEHCYACHSEAEKIKGGLLLDRKAGWAEGGDSGPAIIPGNVEASLLVEAIRYHNPDTEMPPKGKIPDQTIADIEAWIRNGAYDPREKPSSGLGKDPGIDIEAGRQHWAFRPRSNLATPPGETAPIDYLIEKRLEKENLAAAPPATPLERLRRASTDITGLLPTVEEQEEYLENPSEENFARLVDRWLQSPAFGERWGRHWLDLARYSDSSGGGRAMPLYDAWRYRDFIIDSFAHDRPLDELIRMQIAGDLLPGTDDPQNRKDNLVATGFLMLGPHNYENQNKALLDLEIADEQVDTIGRAFLGMTIGCARCHDHKFDPIPITDYYAMAGIFLSTHSVEHQNVSRWHTEALFDSPEEAARREQFEKDQVRLEKEIKDIQTALREGGAITGKSVAAKAIPGIVIDDRAAVLVGTWTQSSSNARYVNDHYLHDGNQDRGTKEVRYTHRFTEQGSYRLAVSYASGGNRTARASVIVNLPGSPDSHYQVNQRIPPSIDRLWEQIGEFEIQPDSEVTVVISNQTDSDGVVIADAIQWIPTGETEAPRGEDDEKLARLQVDLDATQKLLSELRRDAPKLEKAMCVVEAAPDKIGDTPVRIRGVENNHGSLAPRGFLQVASWEPASIPEGHSGRLELAEWIVDPRNPLTARVLSNRIWQHLMGRGIVTTTDNFGTTGTTPSHPDLLDYLANQLIASGWSTRSLIREIVLSDAYSRTSAIAPPESDPDNALYSRGSTRFLDVEVLRDGILTVSGALDADAGGPSLPPGFKSEFNHRFTSTKRSVYVPVFRNRGYEMFGLFDFANPNFTVGHRVGSNIPTQALFLTNSPFIHEQADLAAKRLLSELPDASNQERVVEASRRVLGRPPADEEISLFLDYLNSFDDATAAWAGVFRGLFGCVDYRTLR